MYEVDIDGRVRRVDVQRRDSGFLVTVDGHRHVADVTLTEGVWSLILEDPPADPGTATSGRGEEHLAASAAPASTRHSYEIAIVEQPGTGQLTVHVNGRVVTAAVGTSRGSWARRGHDAGGAAQGPQRLVAPMPGKVVKVLVRPGDKVAARQGLVIVEAMKMENELRSTRAGTVSEVKVAEGSSVEAGAALVIIE
jgi:biotin carboxyl carrier protein